LSKLINKKQASLRYYRARQSNFKVKLSSSEHLLTSKKVKLQKQIQELIKKCKKLKKEEKLESLKLISKEINRKRTNLRYYVTKARTKISSIKPLSSISKNIEKLKKKKKNLLKKREILKKKDNSKDFKLISKEIKKVRARL